MGTKLEVVVGGKWLSCETIIGNLQMSTVYPGGSDELSWDPSVFNDFRIRGRQDVTAYFGGVPVWAGKVLEPDASSGTLTAQGAFRDLDNFIALDSGGAATKIPDTAINQAIARGLDVTIIQPPGTISSVAVTQDISQGPVRVSALLDSYAKANNVSWGVDPNRQIFTQSTPTTPTYQTLPIAGGLGQGFDNYASHLWARHLNGAGTAYVTETASDADAALRWDHVEDVYDFTNLGAVSIAEASNRLSYLLGPGGRSTPQWTESIEVAYGELLNMGGVPVALETVAAGTMLRVNGTYELAQRNNTGAAYVEFIIGRTLFDGATLTLTPLNIAPRTITDILGG